MSETRLELDMKALPEGIVPALRKLANGKGLSVTTYVRTIIVEHVLKSGAV